jgi:ABC-type Zn uptake system ZnuABC Zn-binding protein ZnuA
MTAFFSRGLILSLTACVAAIALSACGDDDEASGSDGKVQVITTLPLFAEFVREVGGDRVDVEALLPAGADPHTWEPSPQDIAPLADADIVFANGLDLEPSALEVIEANLGDAQLVALGEEAEVEVHEGEDEHGHEEGEGEHGEAEEEDNHQHSEGDPHLWMDPANAIAYLTVIRDELATADPEGEVDYLENHDAYVQQIEDADGYLMDATDAVRDENRRLITTHDAFGYLADHLGFEITAFVSEGPGSDTSPDDIRAIVEAVEDAGVPAVFSEPQTSGESEVLEQVAEDTGAEVCTLYSDAFDDEIDTYIEMMRFNADELARCLGGTE